MPRKKKTLPSAWRVERQLIRYVYEHPDITRSDLAKKLGQSPAAISLVIRRLINQDWLRESGRAASLGGRRPVQLRLAGGRAYVLGLDVSPRLSRILLLDADGTVLNHIYHETPEGLPGGELVNQSIELAKKLVAESKIDKEKLLGVGLALTGVVYSDTGIARFSQDMVKWETLNLRASLEKVFPGKIIATQSRANARLGYELYTNTELRNQTVLLEEASYTLGTAMSVHGVLYRGADGASMDPSQFIGGSQLHGIGHLGYIVSEPNIINQIKENMQSGYPTILGANEEIIDICAIGKAAAGGDQLCFKVVCETSDFFGAAIAGSANILRPQKILIAGDLISAGAILPDGIKRQMRLLALPDVYEKASVVVLDPQPNAASIGVAHVVLRQWLEDLSSGKI